MSDLIRSLTLAVVFTTSDIRNTGRIVAVYHRGRLIPNPPPADAQ